MFQIGVTAVTSLKVLYVCDRKCLYVRVEVVNSEVVASCIHARFRWTLVLNAVLH